MREGRWTTVTESEFEHERRGLEAIRVKLPDNDPWRAWSNFTFTASSGHVREVDLLVVAPGGVCMIELKDWHGSVHLEKGSWVQTTPSGGRRFHSNALHLTNRKAKELASLLGRQQALSGRRIWVAEAVCFTDDKLQLRLPSHDLNGVYTVDELVDMLKEPPADERRRIDAGVSKRIVQALDGVGISRSDAQHKVGAYLLERRAFDTGPTWSDYLARHSDLPDRIRVRLFLSERGSDTRMRTSTEAAARREAAVLSRFRHPGVVSLRTYEPSGHPLGPALMFDYHPETLRLDEYLTQYGAKLDLPGRLALVRQLTETMKSAHSRRIYHRALAARSIHVIPRDRGTEGSSLGEEGRWLAPRLQISDWQIATQRSGTATPQGQGMPRLAPTSLSAQHLAEDSDAYLAPELTATRADPVRVDVYGLGVLTYLLVTGQAPAASQAELLAQFEEGKGLTPSALVDGISPDIDDLVEAATAFKPDRRLVSVDDFLEMLECVEESLAEEAAAAEQLSEAPEKDPLDAVQGDVLASRWEVRRRLGTGSTSRALLVRDLQAETGRRGVRSLAVLKIALNDARGDALVREAEVMGRLRADSRVIRLTEPEPLQIGGRTTLAMEYVGDERAELEEPAASGPRRREHTVARQLRERGRLTIDQLEAYGDYLFGAIDFLEGEGVWHRDIKPDNIAIRVRPNGTRELVLLDFSLAGFPARETEAGTDGYLDPFIGTLTRSVYDGHAERYALAVTLHQMASNELPQWGDGSVTPRQTEAKDWPYPTIAADAFEPAIRDGLVTFFRKALHRDATERFKDLKPMRDTWKRIFLDAAATTTSSSHHRTTATGEPASAAEAGEPQPAPAIEPAEPLDADTIRAAQAAKASRETPLATAGLTSAAQSVLHGLGIDTVGELLDYSRRKFLNAPGLGAGTRLEIQRRQHEWTKRLGRSSPAPLSPEGRKAAKEELDELKKQAGGSRLESEAAGVIAARGGGLPGEALRVLSLDALAAELVPPLKPGGANRNEVDAVRLFLRLPADDGALPDIPAWPKQKDVAGALKLSHGRIPQILKDQRQRWAKSEPVRALRGEILELLADHGRVASAAELADALAVRRGTRLPGRDQRRALALAAVRAVVEAEAYEPAKAEFRHQANWKADDLARSAGVLALEVRADDPLETPSAPALLDYATKLGGVADRLAALESLPTSATVLARLGAITPPQGELDWDERKLADVAAAASTRAAVTPRLEIYARDLPLVRALRLTQAGLVQWVPGLQEKQQPGLTDEQIHERVRARFPELVDEHGSSELPSGTKLTKALREAGFDLHLETREGTKTLRYLPAPPESGSQFASSAFARRSTHSIRPGRYDDDPRVAGAVRAEERLTDSARRDGYRILTVRQELSPQAEAELADVPFAARPLSVTRLFLDELRGLLTPGKKPTWGTVVAADAAEPGTPDASRFSRYARTAWGRVEPRVREELATGTGPLLLTDAGVLARYDALGVLGRLAEIARQGGNGLWLLVPQADPAREPRLGHTAVPYQAGLGEWIELSDAWVQNVHRAGLAGGPSDTSTTTTMNDTAGAAK